MADFDTVLINPEPEQLDKALQDAVDAANHKAKQRRILAPKVDGHTFDPPEGVFWKHGGHVPHDYGYTTGTSAIGYAWWTDRQGRKHIRVLGCRIPISGPHVGHIFGPNAKQQPIKQLVYPGGVPEGIHQEAMTFLEKLTPSIN